jgi:putative radical SAM enzyme (TIGR03279 family)
VCGLQTGGLVESVEPGSIAEEIGIVPGDRILAINGEATGDILDWRLAECCEQLLLTVESSDGSLTEFEIEKEYDESLGVLFDSPTLDTVRSCQNRCLFCFVDQLPKGLRSTLYLKDDDYRLSFISGSYITLTNLDESDLDRIRSLHLSPLYISVHATEPQLRQRMLNHRRAGRLMEVLEKLACAGISFHTQVVLCPGLNDGEHLERTIGDLYSLGEASLSLAVVPVGLTGYRHGLHPLSPCERVQALEVLQQVDFWQRRSLRERGCRFVFASDELYTIAACVIPPDGFYEGYPQLENGVGLVRLLYNDWDRWLERLPQALSKKTEATVVTGISGGYYLEPVIRRLNEVENLSIRLVKAAGGFFGGHVTVAGLITAHDILSALKKEKPAGTVYLPHVMVREGKNLFLDGYTVDELSAELGTKVKIVSSLDEFLGDLLQL